MPEPQSVGERLRYVREQQGLSLDRLADKSGVSKSFLSGVENNKSGISGENLLKVANALGASLDYLLRGQPTSGTKESRSVEIPSELGELAEERQLTYGETVALLEVNQSLVARRRRTGQAHMSKDDWEKLYEGVRSFLENKS